MTPDIALIRKCAAAALKARLCEAWGKQPGLRKFEAAWPADARAWRAYSHHPRADVDLALVEAKAMLEALP